MKNEPLHPADWWEETSNQKILCTLCPRYCTIGDGQAGFCFVRKNIDGKLYSTAYGRPTGFAIDPVEKKPLNHFLPGSKILSFGTAGCNLGCKFCQNWSISKARLDSINSIRTSVDDIVSLAKKHSVPSIAFTYNDPVIFGEFVVDVSRAAREEGIKSVMVTAGYIDRNARRDVYKYIDAANVDLKGFSESFYQKLTLSHLEYVLDTLVWLKKETEVWFEITTLLIPGENDSEDELKRMCSWIIENLGDSVPLHFTAFHPDYKLTNKPPTPALTLKTARSIALQTGLKYCYVGNVHDTVGQNTYCPGCGKVLIKRDWHSVLNTDLDQNKCPACRTQIDGVFY